jgi:ferredoxin-NADP reductase
MSSPINIFWGLRHPIEFPSSVNMRRFLSQSTDAGYEEGRITQVLDELEYSENTHFYACGLDQMIEDVLKFFSEKGVEESRLHRECFFTGAPR